jgi:hypothetical protein
MKKWIACFLLLGILSCKEKKTDFSGDVPLKASDFIGAFPKITTVFSVTDTNVGKKADTLTIGYKALEQFVPDSALDILTGKDKKRLQIHPVGLIEKDKENYLLLNFVKRNKTTLGVIVTDKKTKFLGSKELLSNARDDGYTHSVSVNREPTFIVSKERMGKDNTLLFSRTGWVFNNAGLFMVAIHDSNEEPRKSAIINPIDTLSRKNKLSGDYVQDKKNFVSLRDGKDPSHYVFFIHFEKDGGSCTGELKGQLVIHTPNTAQFSASGDPCVIDFNFEGNTLKIKEKGSCGNHRGIKCFFDDSFRKKRESKTARKQG